MTYEHLLTAGEAIEILGIPPARFYRLVDSRTIERIYPDPTSKHGMYSAKQIARLKSKFKRESQAEEGATDWLETSDLGNMYNLEYAAYGDETGSPTIVRKWCERNPYISRVLFNKKDRRDFWGAIHMIPLEEQTIFKLLRKEIRDIELNPQKDILTFEEPGEYNFYVAGVIVHPKKKEHFPMLINSLFAYWCEQAPDRRIGRIYGRLITDDGEMMAKKLYFSPLWDISDTAYMLDVRRPNPSRFVRSFQECVRSKTAQETSQND